jgi:hypothetical protein
VFRDDPSLGGAPTVDDDVSDASYTCKFEKWVAVRSTVSEKYISVGGILKRLLSSIPLNIHFCRSRVTYCRPKQNYKLSNTVQQIDFPRVFHMWSCIQWSFGGNRVVGLNGLPVILPRVMHISTAPLFTIFLMLVKPY